MAARQKNMLVTSFHPELTDDFRFHEYFTGIINSRPPIITKKCELRFEIRNDSIRKDVNNFFREDRDIKAVQGSGSDTERKVISILKVLSESSEPLGSITIARELERYGIFLSERAVRYHLRITDERGYTQPHGPGWTNADPQGDMEELRMALAPDQVGFILDKLEMLAFRTTFDPVKKAGLVPINTSLIDAADFDQSPDSS